MTDYVSQVDFESFHDDYEVIIVGPPPVMKFTGIAVAKCGVPDKKYGFLSKERCLVQLENVDIVILMKSMYA